MEVLAPIDGSECSMRALRFAGEFARRYEADVHVVHVTEQRTEQTEELFERAEAVLEEEGVAGDAEVVTDVRLSEFKASRQVGKDILTLVADRGYDHVVMGHHGTGAVGRILLGSAAETVTRSTEVPVTVVP